MHSDLEMNSCVCSLSYTHSSYYFLHKKGLHTTIIRLYEIGTLHLGLLTVNIGIAFITTSDGSFVQEALSAAGTTE